MKTVTVLMVRIYILESSHLLDSIISYLQKEAKVRGVSVFRAISGYGDSGQQRTAALLTLSLDLPLVIEFFDSKAKIKPVLAHLNTIIKHEHIVMWDALANE